MPRVNRNEIVADDEIQEFHLVNRCVRRTFLCGNDELTGRDFSEDKKGSGCAGIKPVWNRE